MGLTWIDRRRSGGPVSTYRANLQPAGLLYPLIVLADGGGRQNSFRFAIKVRRLSSGRMRKTRDDPAVRADHSLPSCSHGEISPEGTTWTMPFVIVSGFTETVRTRAKFPPFPTSIAPGKNDAEGQGCRHTEVPGIAE